MYFTSSITFAGLYACLLLSLGCKSDLSAPGDFDAGVFPVAPTELKAFVGDSQVVLSWSHPNPENVQSFKIYRQSAGDSSFKEISSTDFFTFTDANLRNGETHRYEVSAVGINGLEGAKSPPVEAIPAVFGVMIQSGNKFTNSRSVLLTLIAPPGTGFVIVSNDSLLTDDQWEPFVATKSWTLSEGDGQKTVYVKFRDAEDRETFRLFTDSIILDTVAFIRSVTEDTQGQVRLPGDTIHFTLDAGEPKGTAWVNISARMTNIQLYDDGTRGDAVKDDSIYELDFVIPPGLEIKNGFIAGFFTDRVGNQAKRVDAPGTVTIQDPPTKVTLLDPSPLQGASPALEIAWTSNTDNDFQSYKLYRANSAGVTLSSALLITITNQATLTYLDTNLQENTVYFYKLYVFDDFGLSTPSNEVKVTTLPNQPPVAVTLTKPTQIDSSTFRLSWTESTDDDFASYRLYRAEDAPVDTTNFLSLAPIGIINNNPAVTTFDDTGLQRNIQYYYVIFVFDKGGLFSGSNEVSGKLND